jgi:hypothetical protein
MQADPHEIVGQRNVTGDDRCIVGGKYGRIGVGAGGPPGAVLRITETAQVADLYSACPRRPRRQCRRTTPNTAKSRNDRRGRRRREARTFSAGSAT